MNVGCLVDEMCVMAFSDDLEYWKIGKNVKLLFRQITTFIKVCVAFCFWASNPLIHRLRLKPKIKDHMNFYELCDSTKKYV